MRGLFLWFMTNTSGTQSGGVLSKQAIYERLSKLTPKAIEELYKLLESGNENVRLGAINKVLDKTVASLKAVEVDGGVGEDGRRLPIQLYINSGHGFIPANIQLSSTSAGSITEQSTAVQGTSLAPQSEEDIHSDIGTPEASVS